MYIFLFNWTKIVDDRLLTWVYGRGIAVYISKRALYPVSIPRELEDFPVSMATQPPPQRWKYLPTVGGREKEVVSMYT